MTFTTPETQAAWLIQEHKTVTPALKAARAALRYHRVNKNVVSEQFWTHTIFILKSAS